MSFELEAFQKLRNGNGGFTAAPPSPQVELRRRAEHLAPLNWRKVLTNLRGEDEQPSAAPKARARAVGSPLQTGVAQAQEIDPGSALTVVFADEEPAQTPARAEDPVAALCSAMAPVVHRILQFFEPATDNPQRRAPGLELAPIEGSLADLTTECCNLRSDVVEQISRLKRTEDRLLMVREATERNTTEKQELIEALRGVRRKTNLVATFALGMLAVSIVIEIALFLHFPVR